MANDARQSAARGPQAARVACLVIVAGLALSALAPWAWSCWRARRDDERLRALIARAEQTIEFGRASEVSTVGARPWQLGESSAGGLACWGNVGGCGASGGGANAAGGGARWIGRSVTGGMADIQVIASQTVLANRALYSTLNSRFATGNALFDKWIIALNVPVLLKLQDVEVNGEQRLASAAGFGDISVQLIRKLGVTNTNLVSVSVAAPTGASEVVRQGVFLPQPVQLGAGLPSLTLQYENMQDFDSGLILTGASLSSPIGGTTATDPEGRFIWGENEIGDYRPPSLSSFIYAGYLLGPFVPSAGLTLTANFGDLRERGEPFGDQPRGIASVNIGCEWSTDVLAVLVSAIGSFASDRVQSVTFALGVSTSVF